METGMRCWRVMLLLEFGISPYASEFLIWRKTKKLIFENIKAASKHKKYLIIFYTFLARMDVFARRVSSHNRRSIHPLKDFNDLRIS